MSLLVAALLCVAQSNGEGRIGPLGPGIEPGTANALAGGRNDVGPLGVTGIWTMPGAAERERAIANDQARGPNLPDSFLRPADTPPQINLNPRPMGSAEPNLPPEQEPQAHGRMYRPGSVRETAPIPVNQGGQAPQGPSDR